MTPKSIPIMWRACAVDAFGPCSGVAFARATVRMVFFDWFPCKTARAPAAPRTRDSLLRFLKRGCNPLKLSGDVVSALHQGS